MGLIDFLKRIFKKKSVDENKESIEDIVDELNKEQKAIKELYEKEGLTDEVFDRQVALNIRRSKYDIPDDTQLVDGWSQ